MSRIRFTLAIASLLAASITLAGCTSISMGGMDRDADSQSGAAEFTDADITFVVDMIPHHSQAVMMADLYLAKPDTDPDVAALAAQIKAAQAPEIETMMNWLDDWDTPMMNDPMDGMDHGNGSGMMSEGDMSALNAATGVTASRLFLKQMTAHHVGAIEMAEVEIRDGSNADAIALAKKIVSDQRAEITVMEELLAGL